MEPKAAKVPETQDGVEAYKKLNEFIAKGKNAGKVQRAKRLIAEFETGFGTERMLVVGASKILDKPKKSSTF